MSSGSLSFTCTKLVMMSSAAAKSAGDSIYVSQDLFMQSTLSHTITTPICIHLGVRSSTSNAIKIKAYTATDYNLQIIGYK